MTVRCSIAGRREGGDEAEAEGGAEEEVEEEAEAEAEEALRLGAYGLHYLQRGQIYCTSKSVQEKRSAIEEPLNNLPFSLHRLGSARRAVMISGSLSNANGNSEWGWAG